MLTPSERILRSRIAAHTLHSRYDSTVLTAPARQAARIALDARLTAEISNCGVFDKIEIARRLDHARRAHFARLALKSAKARRRAVRS